MMNISDQHFKELGMPYFGEVFTALDDVMRGADIPCYLIGAAAKDLLVLRSGIRPIRYTMDIDFAIMVPDHETYDAVMEALLEKHFKRTAQPYRIIHQRTDTIVDILPFGAIEEEGTINFDERQIQLVMLGFTEVLDKAEVMVLDDGRELRVPPLPGMCLLKLLAYSDRPERTKDLTDILWIIEQYFDVAQEDITSNHLDLFEEEPFDRNRCAARVIGRNMGEIIVSNPKALGHVRSILQRHLKDPESSRIAIHWAHESKSSITTTFSWLQAMHAGFQERSTK